MKRKLLEVIMNSESRTALPTGSEETKYRKGDAFSDRTLAALPYEEVQLLIACLQDINLGGEGTQGVT